jgi:hypothetical protein
MNQSIDLMSSGAWEGTLQTINPADNGAGPDPEWSELGTILPMQSLLL